MRILLLVDGEAKTALSEDLANRIRELASTGNHTLDREELVTDSLAPCSGCLQCLKSAQRACVAKDRLLELRQLAEGRDVVVFLSPMLFGQCSATIKNAIDKGVTMQLGGTANARMQFIVGYGSDIDEEERSTFIDIVRKHMGAADIIHAEFRTIRIEAFVARTKADNDDIARKIGECLREGSAA
jgi:multimeric flavodoxin WrbA